MGLIFLMAHAASFQVLPAIEVAGMALLTAGPVLNMCACTMFKNEDPNFFFNRAWMLTESIELLGISILDLSLCDAAHSVILLAEVVGFSILAMAALLQFEFSVASALLPKVSLRLDPIHVFDCLGLASLTVVAIVQYIIKESKHNASHPAAPPPPAPPPPLPLPPASHRQQHHEDDKL